MPVADASDVHDTTGSTRVRPEAMLAVATPGFALVFWVWALLSPPAGSQVSLLAGGLFLVVGGTAFAVGVPLVTAIGKAEAAHSA